jgi:hypothetical protein
MYANSQISHAGKLKEYSFLPGIFPTCLTVVNCKILCGQECKIKSTDIFYLRVKES